MNLPFPANPSRSAIRVVWMVLGGLTACTSRAAPSDAGLDGRQCSQPSSIGLAPYESNGSGIIIGVDVSASVCNVGVLLYTSLDTFPPDQFFMRLNNEVTSLFDFQRPAGATGGLGGFISVGAPTPGVYTSTDGSFPCGIVSFGYALPVAAQTDCSGGISPNCPAGCTPAACEVSDPTCNSCVPLAVRLGFEAQAPSDCVGDAQTSMGSWTLRLDSVAAYQGDAGPPSTYTAHGQLTASLVGAGPADAVTLALAF
ncbi:MAG: hypothetical protein WBP56_10900 [Polyangia bacterium]